MRVLGYLGLLATVVILAILFVITMRSMSGAGVETGEQKAVRELSEPGEEKMDPQSEIRDTVRDAMGKP